MLQQLIRNAKTLIGLAILATTLQSCSFILNLSYGLNAQKSLTEKQIEQAAKKLKLPLQNCYELDTSYWDFLEKLDSIKYAQQIKNHYQPLQALYYNKNGQLVSFHPNCYAGGFPNLKWDRDGRFSSFPPQSAAPLDSILPLETQIKYTKLHALSTPLTNLDSNDYVVFVYWSRMMGRQSKNLVKLVQENQTLGTAFKTRVIYINNDNFLSH